MNITIQDFKAFKLAAELQNFTQAAKQLYMTQPAFSRLIASLEMELGVKLFNRTTRTVRLTPEGQICLLRVNQILDSYDLLLSNMERARHGYAGELHVGFNPVSGPPRFFVDALKRLQEEYPDIAVTLTRSYSDDLVSQIKDGRLDCALVSGYYIAPSDNLIQKTLQSIQLYALVHTSHPLAERDCVTIRELSSWPLVFMQANAPRTYETVIHEFRRQELPSPETISANDLDDLIMQVRISHHIGISSFCDPNHQYDDIEAKSILELRSNGNHAGRGLAWHKSCSNPALFALCDVLDKGAEERRSSGPYPFD